MKKTFLSLSAFCLLLSLNSCDFKAKTVQNQISTEQVSADAAFAVKPITIEDSTETNSVHFKYSIDFPQKGSEALTSLVKKTIFNVLNDSTTNEFTIENLENIGKKYVAASTADIEELGFEDREISYDLSGEIRLAENTGKYLTYHVNDYNYAGGAHGMPRNFYITFDKENNQRMDWNNIFPEDNRQDLEAIIMAAIVEQYYEGETPQWGEYFQFALPAQAPAFTAEGLIFTYYPYEIDCYAAGLPKCVIPYNEVKTLMTPEAQALVD